MDYYLQKNKDGTDKGKLERVIKSEKFQKKYLGYFPLKNRMEIIEKYISIMTGNRTLKIIREAILDKEKMQVSIHRGSFPIISREWLVNGYVLGMG